MARKKLRRRTKSFDSRIAGLIFLIIILSAGLLTIIIINARKFSTAPAKTEAQDCTGHEGAFGDNSCKWSCNIQLNGNPVNNPSCCDEIEKTGDPTVCVFDARRVCTPQQCSTIPDGVKRQRCAQLWELGCCPVWTSACELKPPPELLSLAPTQPVIPTVTRQVTSTPIPQPTAIPATTTPVPTHAPLIPTRVTATSGALPTQTTVHVFPTAYITTPVPVSVTPSPKPVLASLWKDTAGLVDQLKELLSKVFSSVLP